MADASAVTLEFVRVWGGDRGRVAGPAPSLALTDDPGLVLAASSAGFTWLDAREGGRVAESPWVGDRPDGAVTVVASGAAGSRLLAGTSHGEVLLADPRDGRVLRRLGGRRGAIGAASLSHDARVAAAASDGDVLAWEAATGRALLQMRGGPPVALSPSGSWLAAWVSAGPDASVRLRHVTRGTRRRLQPQGAARFFCWSADERSCWVVTDAAVAERWSLPEGDAASERLARVSFVPSCVAAACTRDGGLALLGARGEVWRLGPRGDTRVVAGAQDEPIEHAAVSPDGLRAAWLRHVTTLCVQDLSTGRRLHHHAEHAGAITAVALSDDGALAATASNDRTVRVWRVDSGDTLWVLEGAAGTPAGVAFSPDRARLHASCADGFVRAWSLDDGAEFEPTPCPVYGDLRASPDGERLVVTHGERRGPWLVDPRRGVARQIPLDASLRVGSVGFSGDGAEVVALAASSDTDWRTYALRYLARDGSPTVPSSARIDVVMRELRGRELPVARYWAPALSHDCAFAAAEERTPDGVTVWDVGASAPVAAIRRAGRPYQCAPSALGATLLVVPTRDRVEVWDHRRAALVAEVDLGAPQEHPVVVALSRDERTLLTATTLGRVHHHRIVR